MATLPHTGSTPVSRFAPRMPETIAALGISENLVLDLVVRRLLLEGTSTLSSLAAKLRVSAPVVDHIFTYMRKQQLAEGKGMVGNDYFSPTPLPAANLPASAFKSLSTPALAPFHSRNTTPPPKNRRPNSKSIAALFANPFST